MKHLIILWISALGLGLTACSGTKETLGLSKPMPDEFAVVKRAPLSMPPDYTLRPPEPGAPRPQEQATNIHAREAIFGAPSDDQAAGYAGPENALLDKAGAAMADPAIRQKVDAETAAMGNRNQPVAQKLLGIGGDPDTPSATVVDAKEEAERIKKNAEEGKPVTEGETPYIDE